MSRKQIVVFDFDGVIHSYTSGWQGIDVILDEPIEGMKEVIATLRLDYKIIVVSSRCVEAEGITAIGEWLRKHDILVDGIQASKPPAYVTIDDRAITFKGSNNLIEDITNFRPYRINKRS
jgi:FMN phosphatase YigB (HAD superfamily)